MARAIFLSLLFVFSALASSVPAVSAVYHYAPEFVELRGVIEKQTFPGRPGYESIANGDEVERGWYLRVYQPIDLEKSGSDSDPNASNEKNVRILQLAMNYDTPLNQIPLGRKVCVDGQLFHAISGHHHSRVLLDVKEIKSCK